MAQKTIQEAQAELAAVEQAIADRDILRLLQIDGPGIIKVIEKINAQDDDRPTLVKALANTPNARTKPNIVLGKHPTKVGMHTAGMDKRDTSSRAFNNAGNLVSKMQKSMSEAEYLEHLAREKFMSEDQIANHRSVGHEVQWIDGSQRNKVATVKRAVLKSVANRKACEAEHAPHGVNKVAENILAAKVAGVSLKEYVSGQQNSPQTAAQKSIMPHKMASEESVRNRFPPEFRANPLSQTQVQKNVADAETAIRMKSYDTRSSLPNEWKPRIEISSDNSYKAEFGRMKVDTKAGKSLDKGKPDFSKANPHETPQGAVADKFYGGNKPPKPESVTNSAENSYKEKNQRKTRDGYTWPEEPTGDAGSNIESGRGYF